LKLFPDVAKGPQARRTSPALQEKIIHYRKQNNSAEDIHNILTDDGDEVSPRTIERILKQAGFKKLKRRTHVELGITTKNKLIPFFARP
jgi:hypothetical protein